LRSGEKDIAQFPAERIDLGLKTFDTVVPAAEDEERAIAETGIICR
jgi:hypothetical protein